jgi:hypothetical protein
MKSCQRDRFKKILDTTGVHFLMVEAREGFTYVTFDSGDVLPEGSPTKQTYSVVSPVT